MSEAMRSRVAKRAVSDANMLSGGLVQVRRSAGGQTESVTPLVDEALRSAGEPLDPHLRAFMEARFRPGPAAPAPRPRSPGVIARPQRISRPQDDDERQAERFAESVAAKPASSFGQMGRRAGWDFGQVRVHDDDRAHASARRLNALAYTVGDHIIFAAGAYDGSSAAGRALLAHELAHVVQQRAGWTMAGLQRAGLTYDPTRFSIPLPPTTLTLANAQNLVDKKKAASPPDIINGVVKGAAAGSVEEIFLWFILAELAARDRWGTEADLITAIGWPAKPGDPAPVGKVTVTIDSAGNGVAELLSAGAVVAPSTYKTRADAEAQLKTTYAIDSVADGDKAWTVEELNKVVGAFALLPAGDKAALKGVQLVRMTTLSGKEAGEFEFEQSVSDTTVTDTAKLKLADDAFAGETQSFVGGKAVASPASYLVIVHEVGHAVASARLRKAVSEELAATAAANALVEPLNEAVAERNAAADEYNDLVRQYNELVVAYNQAARGKDKAATAAAKKAVDDKKKEVDAKKAEVDRLKREETTKRTALTAARKTETDKKRIAAAARIPAASLALFKATMDAKKTVAERTLKAAQGAVSAFPQQDATDSESYRKAVDAAASAIDDYVKAAAPGDQDLDTLDSTADAAIAARNQERDSLKAQSPANAALSRFVQVETAQDEWLSAAKAFAHATQRSRRVQNFVDFVTAHKITPFTQYAKDNWPLKPEEFFAEADSLWRTDPDYLKANSRALFDWFNTGRY